MSFGSRLLPRFKFDKQKSTAGSNIFKVACFTPGIPDTKGK